MTTLRLILGDQLNCEHSWFQQVRDDVIYVLMEVRQETDYVLHHAQKIIAIFAAMRAFSARLHADGHKVHYIAIDDADNLQSLPDNLNALIATYRATALAWQAPDEWRLDQQLHDYARTLSIYTEIADTEHFYSARDEAATFFGQRSRWVMEHFYRHMRLRHGVMVSQTGAPAGGQWNFDHDNREAWRGTPWEPGDSRPGHDHGALWATIEAAGVRSFGQPQADNFRWPLNREEALQQLEAFVEHALPHFGRFQDAMSYKAWRLFHSLLSFAMNVKLLSPHTVVARVEQAWRDGQAPIAAAEGYIRQILGWREYVRGVYWHRMPGYDQLNAFGHETPLPWWFWNGETRMRCLASAIGQSLEHAHSHHINRLMVIGNFALLAGLSPQQLHQWYLGIYIDAFEWVELPNTLGMSQYADGGLLATKPYISSAAYIDRMSDYCKGCHYDKKQRVGERACPYNALYWDFLDRNRERLEGNHRMAMMYKQLQRISEEDLAAIRERSAQLRADLNAT
ncbi:deoxyribodipyrimidine photolyase-related protein [Duganella sp. CF402]|uniref:cryptochrome/photolyase family protein n=1 Tax=unclassified Duganella TaxID=2636909 RepID=UPI0008B2C85B|nr:MULTISPECIES: cryptochrome/photolyase family protein [unclassified Duganella]RZT10844.1 deoxyribodipyrimidine photolyase-related protein [Duganella sp. BK701]SEK93990.1 deoxyribodipyrimidine photolyase-related protein [Duganella sp. CF402]